MELRLAIEGAKPEGIARGVDAAQVVFDREGIAAEVAASGAFAVYIRDIKGFLGSEAPSESQRSAANIWQKAERVAYEACCAGWREQPVVSRWALCLGPTEPRVKTANPATWPEDSSYTPSSLNIEAATGPDRQLDIDICYVMGWVNERGTPEEAAELGCHISRANWQRLRQSRRSLFRAGRSRSTKPLAMLASSRRSATKMTIGAWLHGAPSMADFI
ncbi:hypothetical protein NKI31_12650 [Mesorhizobium sp. M0659]|uniref:hypothetical protein n=1 Tax=Mesorhizobium sp. M0659 TaxID=2956980 RepID=UPI00333A4E7E